MAFFPMACVLRGFLPSTYSKYASDKNPCAALSIEKIAHLGTENKNKYYYQKGFLRANIFSPTESLFCLKLLLISFHL
jgi:hypothetical protein